MALAVGINILWTGYSLLRDSVSSLLSEALPDDERQNIRQLLARLEQEHSVNFTDRRTVASGRQRSHGLAGFLYNRWASKQADPERAKRFGTYMPL